MTTEDYDIARMAAIDRHERGECDPGNCSVCEEELELEWADWDEERALEDEEGDQAYKEWLAEQEKIEKDKED